MSHTPETVKQYVCSNCQVTHAGTPIHTDTGDHDFEPPTTCGACGETEFVSMTGWIHYHD